MRLTVADPRRSPRRRAKDLQDAFGHALRDYLRGRGRGYEVLERDDGYVDISWGREVYLADYRRWPAHHRQAIRDARGRVLDIGCGAGRHALYLQRKGLDVVGIDVSPLATAVCRRRGLRQARTMSVTQVSSALGTFSTVQTDNPFHRAYQRLNRRRRRMAGQLRIRVRYQRYVTPWFDYLMVSRREMRAILRGTGWTVRRVLQAPGGPTYIAVIAKARIPR